MRLISSMLFWPTSARIRSPLARVEREAIRIAEAVGVDLRDLAGALERIGGGNAILAVAR